MIVRIVSGWLCAVATLLPSCTLPARDEAGLRRVSPQEIQEITPLIHKRLVHSRETIASFGREDSGAIRVWTDEGTIYVVRRVDQRWKIIDVTGVEY